MADSPSEVPAPERCNACHEAMIDGYCHNKQCSRHGRRNDYSKTGAAVSEETPLPCPFCGVEMYWYDQPVYVSDWSVVHPRVKSSDGHWCLLDTQIAFNLAAWNRRPSESPPAPIRSVQEFAERFFPEYAATNPCSICGKGESEHAGIEKFCPVYATFRPLSVSPPTSAPDCKNCSADERHHGNCACVEAAAEAARPDRSPEDHERRGHDG